MAVAVGSILESHVFVKTHRLNELLNFLAEQTMKGNLHALKLRLKLDEYYQAEGAVR